jgi:hypothetical protein
MILNCDAKFKVMKMKTFKLSAVTLAKMNDYKSNFYRHMHIGMSGIVKLLFVR